MKYVLFRDDPNTHKEVYVGASSDYRDWSAVRSLREAMKFQTARQAYEYGAQHKLSWWRVGQR